MDTVIEQSQPTVVPNHRDFNENSLTFFLKKNGRGGFPRTPKPEKQSSQTQFEQ